MSKKLSKKPWVRGKGGKGYKLLGAGKAMGYMELTIPHGLGFIRGQRVFFRSMVVNGLYGVFMALKEDVESSEEPAKP